MFQQKKNLFNISITKKLYFFFFNISKKKMKKAETLQHSKKEKEEKTKPCDINHLCLIGLPIYGPFEANSRVETKFYAKKSWWA